MNSSIDYLLILETVLSNIVQHYTCDLFFSAEMISLHFILLLMSAFSIQIFFFKYYTFLIIIY